MAKCAYCKAEETQLYLSGLPICLKCEEKRSLGLPLSPPPQQSLESAHEGAD